MTNFTIYKIYDKKGLIYVGRTKQKLQDRLRGHFFKRPMYAPIDITSALKIEYAELPSEADMFLYEIYYINKLKPPLNRDDKAYDKLTVDLPPVQFKEYECKLIDKWTNLIIEQGKEKALRTQKQFEAIKTLREMRKKRRNGEITEDEYFDAKERIER